jgi:3-oxoacyl-[acyl-carrier-protein] synthase III
MTIYLATQPNDEWIQERTGQEKRLSLGEDTTTSMGSKSG